MSKWLAIFHPHNIKVEANCFFEAFRFASEDWPLKSYFGTGGWRGGEFCGLHRDTASGRASLVSPRMQGANCNLTVRVAPTRSQLCYVMFQDR